MSEYTEVEQKFNLQENFDLGFFPEWQNNLPEGFDESFFDRT
jgi:hypothetical protein